MKANSKKTLARQGRPPMGKLARTGLLTLLEPHAAKFIRDWPGDFTFADSDLWPLFIAAADPDSMNAPENDALRRHFARLYAARPDFILAFMVKLRELISAPDHAAVAKRFIMARHGAIDDEAHINSDDTERSKEAAIIVALKKIGVSISPAVAKKARQDLVREFGRK